jgi:hypothetical protein
MPFFTIFLSLLTFLADFSTIAPETGFLRFLTSTEAFPVLVCTIMPCSPLEARNLVVAGVGPESVAASGLDDGKEEGRVGPPEDAIGLCVSASIS